VGFTYVSANDDDKHRTLRGLVKAGGFYKSPAQAGFIRAKFQTRINAYYGDGMDKQIAPVYDRGESAGLSLTDGQIYVEVRGSMLFQAGDGWDEHQGRQTGYGGHRPVRWGYILDGAGVLTELKYHFKSEGGGRNRNWVIDRAKTEVLFTRGCAGTDLWATADKARADELAAREEQHAKAANAPKGRMVIAGKIISAKWQQSQYGLTQKMLLLTNMGWKLYCTVPSGVEPEVGTEVKINVTVEPSKDDAKFAFGSRPALVK